MEVTVLEDIEGEVIDLTNKITVINVWATWCGTCISEIEAHNRLRAKYANHPNIQFVAISDESESVVRSALNRWPFHYQHVINGAKISDDLQSRLVKTYPQNLIVDRNGTIVYEHSDGSSDIFKTLDEKITDLLETISE